ncbi:MAG TPA: hypothetical protein VFQ92_17095 [Blastocatellia bacterium]|nr:hypothetical protein [Blastocatellia bacterium]
MRTSTMADVAISRTGRRSFRQAEFLVFSIAIFVAKSFLLVRLPYRTWDVNAFYTSLILIAFYCYFRFRYGITPPAIVVFFLGGAVAVDVVGNYQQLYGLKFGPVKFDEFSHFITSAFSLVPTMWLLRATTRRFGLILPLNLLAFFSVCITFSFAAYYEILELWDEKFYGDFTRLWTPQDSANDLQFNLAGIIVAALLSALYYKSSESKTV